MKCHTVSKSQGCCVGDKALARWLHGQTGTPGDRTVCELLNPFEPCMSHPRLWRMYEKRTFVKSGNPDFTNPSYGSEHWPV